MLHGTEVNMQKVRDWFHRVLFKILLKTGLIDRFLSDDAEDELG